jgi:hypothetical protein
MIQLPEGFDVAALFADFFALAAPFISISLLIATFYLINRILKKAP